MPCALGSSCTVVNFSPLSPFWDFKISFFSALFFYSLRTLSLHLLYYSKLHSSECWIRKAWVHIPTLLLTSCVTLNKLFNLSVGLGFFTCKMGILTVPTSRVVVRLK